MHLVDLIALVLGRTLESSQQHAILHLDARARRTSTHLLRKRGTIAAIVPLHHAFQLVYRPLFLLRLERVISKDTKTQFSYGHRRTVNVKKHG